MTVKNIFVVLYTFLLTTTILFGDTERHVNVYNWSDYIDQEVIKQFENQTGIKVIYDVYDSNEILQTKMLAGGSGYDVIVPSAEFLARIIQAGVVQKLNKSDLPNLKNAWQYIVDKIKIFDPNNSYSVNYMWGTVGIAYNTDAIKARNGGKKPTSWSLVFDPKNLKKFEDCGVYFLDAPADMIRVVLLYLGEDANTTDPKLLKKAKDTLLKVRPYIKKFHSSEYINALASGDICMAIGWSGDVMQAKYRAIEAKNKISIEYLVPKEGSTIWFDQLAIPIDAPHPKEAHEFINFLLTPEIAAKITNKIRYPSGNIKALSLIDPDIRNNSAIYPPKDIMQILYSAKNYDSKTIRLVTKLWSKLKQNK